jgi:hypothetical protein
MASIAVWYFCAAHPVELFFARARNAGHTSVEVGDGAAQGARGDTVTFCLVARDCGEPVQRLSYRTRRQHAERVERLLFDDKHGGVGEAARREHRSEVG